MTPPSDEPSADSRFNARAAFITAIVVALIGVISAVLVVRLQEPQPSTWDEQVANRAGAPVFADTQAFETERSITAGTIPYGTIVQVTCKVPNTTGIPDILYWYQIETESHRGLYAPSDVFANGDALGTTGTTRVDRNVVDCD